MSLREDSILFLLGAGASVDAGIKHAKAMTEDIEKKIISDDDFTEFHDLYNYLKAQLFISEDLRGLLMISLQQSKNFSMCFPKLVKNIKTSFIHLSVDGISTF